MEGARVLLDYLLVVAAGVTVAYPLGYLDPFVAHATAAGSALTTAEAAQEARSVLDDVEKVFQILAYIVGAVWIYFNYLRGRTYRQRLEPVISGRLCRQSDPEMIQAVVRVKNVGLTKVDLQQSGTGLRFLVWDASVRDNWRHVSTQVVFEHHGWIEPGETVEDHVILATQLRGVPAVKLELVLSSGKIMWQAVAILT